MVNGEKNVETAMDNSSKDFQGRQVLRDGADALVFQLLPRYGVCNTQLSG